MQTLPVVDVKAIRALLGIPRSVSPLVVPRVPPLDHLPLLVQASVSPRAARGPVTHMVVHLRLENAHMVSQIPSSESKLVVKSDAWLPPCRKSCR